jgi:hypothetical protein
VQAPPGDRRQHHRKSRFDVEGAATAGAEPGDRAALGAPVAGTLFFAGEATHPAVNPCMQVTIEYRFEFPFSTAVLRRRGSALCHQALHAGTACQAHALCSQPCRTTGHLQAMFACR